MDPMENNSITDNSNSEEQQNKSEGAESSGRPSLSQFKKSWGFRRTTIAKREFLDEIGDLALSPPPLRRGRTRRTNQPAQATTCVPQTATTASRSAIDDLEWSAPSSPASEESKPASEMSVGGCLDPMLWQDFGSAFHTAFSLLGGNEDLPLEMSDSLAIPDVMEATDEIESQPLQAAVDEPQIHENMECIDDMEILHTVSPDNTAGEEIDDDVVLISSKEEDSDEMTLLQIKEHVASKGKQGRARGGKGGKGKARGRGRGRGRGKGRGRGRGRAKVMEIQSCIGDDEDGNDDVILVDPAELLLHPLQEEEKVSELSDSAKIELFPAHSEITEGSAQRLSSDCIYIESDLGPITDATPGQYDDAPEEQQEVTEEEEKNDNIKGGEYSCMPNSKLYDSNVLDCICHQKHSERFMICCQTCKKWFHGSCVGISEIQGGEMERSEQEYICPRCTKTTKSKLHPDSHCLPEAEPSLNECLTISSSGEEEEDHGNQKLTKDNLMVLEEEEEKETPVMGLQPEPEAEVEVDTSLPLCIGPLCSKQALPDSVYCGTDCILKHAAVTMKTLSVPSVPKSKGHAQKKAPSARPTPKGERSVRMSKRLSRKAEEEGVEKEIKEDGGGPKEDAIPLACDPSLKEVQATPQPSSKFYTASKMDNKHKADVEDVAPSKRPPEDASKDAFCPSQPMTEQHPPQSHCREIPSEPIISVVSKEQSAESSLCSPPNREKSSQSLATQSPFTSAPRHHETGALMVTKTTYVIPKKQSVPQAPSCPVLASVSSQKPTSAPSLLNESRNLRVPPAPSAPSSRPSQPNNQVRQSIQRSLTSILFKRVCDCEDLKMSESEVAKLVASIEMEMFDIFRNTDSKYMNKYRTIMFNLKDPKNKGLLYRVVHGEISPFRLVRMSQKDMQAIKASEPSTKETTEVKESAAKVSTLLQKPEAVKVDLPSLSLTRPVNSTKKSLPVPATKTRTRQQAQSSALPDILTCMLKDTTSEHKAHLFDLKCKICTGQMQPGDEEEAANKKPKPTETKEKYESSWRKSARDESPLRAPPDSPDMDSPTSFLMDPSSHLSLDSPVLTIVESPASPTMDSLASPTLDSPASPVMDSPASPNPENPKATISKRAYTPVVIPAVSTVTITRRDPRTAARFSSPSSGPSHHNNPLHSQSAPSAPLKETIMAPPAAPASSLPPTKLLPKSILMKPLPSADPRLYGASSRNMISVSHAHNETSQFLAKQEILWKGYLNMLTVTKFVSRGYLVSGSAENMKADLPDSIQIDGRISPETVWEYVAKLKTSVTKELCVIRFHPATEEEEVAYVSLFSYFSSRGRFGVVSNNSRSIKDLYLVPLSAKESIPSILQPLEGPGLEKKRPNLLLGLAIIQKLKCHGNAPQETEEKRPKVHMSKDPMWIPKPPVLYGSDKLEIFKPYDPETPANTTPPSSPSNPGSPSEYSSTESVTNPSLLTTVRSKPPVFTSAAVTATQPTSNIISDKNPTTTSSDKMPLQTIWKSLFGNKQTDTSSTAATVGVKKLPSFPPVSGSMLDPIVQQYGHKSKVQKIEEQIDFDRPYDPEEEYEPTLGYGNALPQITEKTKEDEPPAAGYDDDVAYDPEDETIFEDIQNGIISKPLVPSETDSSSNPASMSVPATVPASVSNPVQTSSPVGVMQNLPTGAIVVSAATLTEQQRMLEELNKQIEEQKQQLKVQEEALRQQREAVGMFMAHFSVSDSMLSPPLKSVPLSQSASQQSLDSRASQSTDKTSSLDETVDSFIKTSSLDETVDSSNVDSQIVKIEEITAIPNLNNDDPVIEQTETQENVKESDKYSSAGEIEDSDVAYDPEDETLFDEIQEDVFRGGSTKSCDSSLSRSGHSSSHKGTTQNSHRSRKRRQSPKKRSHHERDHNRSPSRKSHQRSSSRSRRRSEKERHRRSERDRSRHRVRDQSERQGRHRKEHTIRRHSHGHKRSPSLPGDSLSISPKQHRQPSPKLFENYPSSFTIKNDPDGHQFQCDVVENPDKDCSQSSHELLPNVKLETSDVPMSQEFQTISVGKHDHTGSSTQVDISSQQETKLQSKFECTIPLREIEPPIRDSPQSPDPEPQFVNPFSIAKSDHEKTNIIRQPMTNTSVSVQLGEVENNGMLIGGQTTIANVRNVDFKALHLQCSGLRDQGVIETHKLIEGRMPYVNSELRGQGFDVKCDTSGLGSRESLSTIDHPSPDIRTSLIVDEIGSQGGNRAQEGLLCPKTDEHKSQPENTNSKPDVLEMGRDLFFPGPQIHSASDNTGKIKGQNKKDMSYIRQGESGPREDFKGQPAISAKWKACGPGKRESDTIHELKTVDMAGRGLMGHGRNIDGIGSSDSKADRRDSHLRSSSREIGEIDQNRTDVGIHENNRQGLGLERREVGPDMWNDKSQSKDTRSHMIAPDCIGPGSGPGGGGMFIEDEWRGHQHNRRGPNIEDTRNDWRRSRSPQFVAPDRENIVPDMQVPVHDRHGPGTPGFRRPEPERRGPAHDDQVSGIRGPGGRDFMGPGLEVKGPHMEGPNRRGPSVGTNFRGTWPERRGPDLECYGTDRQEDFGSLNFSEPGPGRRGFSIEGPRPARIGPGVSDFRELIPEMRGSGVSNFKGPAPESRGLSIEGPRPDRRLLGDPDLGASEPENRDLSMEGSGSERRGPGGLDFRGQAPDRRSLSMGGSGPYRRGQGGPDCRGPGRGRIGPGIVSPVPERRGLGGSDFRGPEFERRDTIMEDIGMDRSRPEGPDFSGPGPNRCHAVEGPSPHRRESGVSDFSGPEHGNKGAQGPDWRPPEDQNPAGMGPDKRGPYKRGPGPNFVEQGPEQAGICMEGPWPHSRGQHFRGPNMESLDNRAPRPDRPESGMESPGINRRGPGCPNLRRPVPQHTGLNIGDPVHERRCPEGPDFRCPAPERRPPDVEGRGNDRGFPGGPQFRGPAPQFGGPEPERRLPDTEGTGNSRGFPVVPQFRGHAPKRKHPDVEGTGFNRSFPGGPQFRGPAPKRRPSDIEGTGNSMGFPEGPQFSGPALERRPPERDGPESHKRGPDFRGERPERMVIDFSRAGSHDPRGLGCESRGPEWSRKLGPGPGIRQKVPNTDQQRHSRDDWGGDDFGVSECIQEGLGIERPGTDRIDHIFGGPGSMRRNVRESGPALSSLNPGDRWKGSDFMDSTPDGINTHLEDEWSDGRGENMDAVVNESQVSGNEWKIHDNRGPGPFDEGPVEQFQDYSRRGPPMAWRGRGGAKLVQERPNMRFPVPFRSPGANLGGLHCRAPGPVRDDPDMVGPMTSRAGSGNEWRGPDRGAGQTFRGVRDPDDIRQGYDARGPALKGPRTNMREGSGIGNDWGQPDMRSNMGGPNMERPRGGPELMNKCPNRRGFEMGDRRGPRGPDPSGPGPKNRNSNFEGPGNGGRFSDYRGLRSERQGVDIETARIDRQGFNDFRRERRGPDMRRHGPDKTDLRVLPPEGVDVRHGHGGQDTIEDSGRSEPTSSHLTGPRLVARFQGPSDPQSAPCTGPPGPIQNNRKISCPDFDNPQTQQVVKPQRNRGALLPTPTDGPVRFPNRPMNNPEFSQKQKTLSQQTERPWGKGFGPKCQQDRSLAGKISTHVDAGRVGGEKKDNETDKKGVHGASSENKTDQAMDSNANKSNVKPS